MTAPVIVTDAEQRAALAVVRSLGRAGHSIVVTGGSRGALAGASRYSRRLVTLPDPLRDVAAYQSALVELVRTTGAGAVIPIAEPSILALLARRSDLPGVVIPFPPLDTFRAISDKARLLALAPELGIAVPRQWTLSRPADGGKLLEEPGLAFPMVLKPSRSVAEAADGRRIKLTVGYAASRDEMRGALAALPEAAYPLLLQQRIVGPGIGVFLLVWDGEVLGEFAHRRLREKPPSGGVSVYRESTALAPDLAERSLALLRRFEWQGVAMIEYKVDATDGRPYLMEINGRFWGSLQLAIDAGVDFPRLLLDAATGKPVVPVRDWQSGVRLRWWLGDFDHLLTRLRHSQSKLALPPGSPGVGREILEFLTIWRRGDRNEVLRWDDPRPGVQELLNWVRGR